MFSCRLIIDNYYKIATTLPVNFCYQTECIVSYTYFFIGDMFYENHSLCSIAVFGFTCAGSYIIAL